MSIKDNSPKATVLTVKTVHGDEAELRTTDVARLDLSNSGNWAQMSILIQVGFISFMQRRYPELWGEFEQNGLRDRVAFDSAFDEFIVEQAQMIGLRVLFEPKVMHTLYQWTQHPETHRELWRRFAKNVQDGFDGKQIVISDERTPQAREELIGDLKKLRPRLRSKKATELPWNFSLHVRNLESELEKFPGETLASNGTKFITFVEENEQIYKNWLLFDGRVSHADLANHFLAYCHRYRSPESARQATQKLKRRSMLKARTNRHR